MMLTDEQYEEEIGLKAGDLILVVREVPPCQLVYRVDGYVRVDFGAVFAIRLRRCSSKIEDYGDYAVVSCEEFKVWKSGLIQGHRVKKITEKEAIFEML